MNLMPRSWAKRYANSHGYFWLPCPYPECGRMFGGHECGDYVMYYPDEPTIGKMCCKLHDEDTPIKVFERTGEWVENLTLPKKYYPEFTFEI